VDSFPAWSPDGGQIAFHSDRNGNFDIYIMNADGSDIQQVTSSNAMDGYPTWSPDGGQIAFQSQRDGNWEIYLINTDGTGATRLTQDTAEDTDPDWSPGGDKIVFQSDRDGDLEIYTMGVDGQAVTQLTENAIPDQFPAWSPDGQQIAFSSVINDNFEIIVMDKDGSEWVQVTDDPVDNPYEDTYPTWSNPGFTLTEEPWFGPPFIARDTDGDFQADSLGPDISMQDTLLFIGFPFRNMENGKMWNMNVDLGGMKFNNSLTWELEDSGVYFNNIPIFSPSPSASSIQLIVDEEVLQEIKFEVIE
jgi:Tol biopolymer transport system component